MQDLLDASLIHPLPVLVAALAGFAVGGLWYGPLFGAAWQQETGVRAEQMKSANLPRLYGSVLALNLVGALALTQFIGRSPTWQHGLLVALAAGLTLVSTSLAVSYLFEFRSLKLWCINAGYQTVIFGVMGTILGAWH